MAPTTSDAQYQIVQTAAAEDVDVVARVGSATGTEAVWLVGHFVGGDFDVCRVVAGDVAPAVGAEVAGGEQVDGAVALAEDDAVVDVAVGRREARVDGNVEVRAEGAVGFLVEVPALRRLADAVEAVDLQIWGEGQAGFEWVEPGAWDVFVRFDFGFGVCDAVRVGVLHGIGVPVFGVGEKVFEGFVDGEVVAGDVGFVDWRFEGNERAEGVVLQRGILVVWRKCHVAPDCAAPFGEHGGDAGHSAEDLGAIFFGEELLKPIDGEGIQLCCIFHLT